MRWGSAGSGNRLYEERKVGERRQENQSVGLCPQSLVLGPASRGTCRRYDHGPSVRPLHGSWGAQQRGPARNGSWELWAPFSGRGVGLGGASGWGHGAATQSPNCGTLGPCRFRNTWGCWNGVPRPGPKLLPHLALRPPPRLPPTCPGSRSRSSEPPNPAGGHGNLRLQGASKTQMRLGSDVGAGLPGGTEPLTREV